MSKDDDGLSVLEAIGLGLLGVAAVVGVIFLAKITYDKINAYLDKAKENPNADFAELIKQRLDSGNYRVVANIFNNKEEMLDTQTWEGKNLDDALHAEFGGQNKIVYALKG
ncbi:MAG: hypothetical protein FWG66_03350 [Spirochaetes bacterium]|nr:hypothetical protein [Spirochaetota bacterium]